MENNKEFKEEKYLRNQSVGVKKGKQILSKSSNVKKISLNKVEQFGTLNYVTITINRQERIF